MRRTSTKSAKTNVKSLEMTSTNHSQIRPVVPAAGDRRLWRYTAGGSTTARGSGSPASP